jgi:hypothetical protein
MTLPDGESRAVDESVLSRESHQPRKYWEPQQSRKAQRSQRPGPGPRPGPGLLGTLGLQRSESFLGSVMLLD